MQEERVYFKVLKDAPWAAGVCVPGQREYRDKSPYQDQLPVVGQLSGPSCFGPVSFLQRLLTADLTVGFPPGETLPSLTAKRADIIRDSAPLGVNNGAGR